MLPLPNGTWILAEFVERMENMGGGQPYIISTTGDGLLFKRVENRLESQGNFLLVSNNPQFDPYPYAPVDIREAWKAIGWFSTDWPETSS